MNVALLLVCIVSGVAPGAAPEPVTLYYWGNDVETFAPDLIQDFETRHDGSDGKTVIKVIMGQSATFNKTDDPQRLLTAVAGGSPPDVVWFDRFAVGEWAARGAFQSLQPFLERDLAERPDDELTLKLRELETMSDPVLSLKIQEWLSEHKGEINIADFSKVYNVSESRVEQMLNKMVTEGYLATKG